MGLSAQQARASSTYSFLWLDFHVMCQMANNVKIYFFFSNEQTFWKYITAIITVVFLY